MDNRSHFKDLAETNKAGIVVDLILEFNLTMLFEVSTGTHTTSPFFCHKIHRMNFN